MKHSDDTFFQHSRTPALDDLEPNLCHEAWVQYKATGQKGWDLSGSNPTQTSLPSIHPDPDIMRAALDAPYEASSQGLDVARRAIAEMYDGLVDPACIQLFASTSEAIGALLKLLCAPGDNVVTCTPTYPLLDCLTALEGVSLLEVPLQDCAGIWAVDLWALERTCSPNTRALLLVSPNNPTGHLVSRDEMAALVEFCAQRAMALIVDEVFSTYCLRQDGDAMPKAAAAHFSSPRDGLIVSLNGLSKVCGLPQHKLGWGIFGGAPNIVHEAMQRMSFITDSTLSVSGWVQRMTPYFLSHRDDFAQPCLARLRQNLATLESYAQKDNVQWRLDRVQGGWSACLRLPARADDMAICAHLASRGVRVFPGSFFDFREKQPACILSLITEPDCLDHGLQILTHELESLL